MREVSRTGELSEEAQQRPVIVATLARPRTCFILERLSDTDDLGRALYKVPITQYNLST
jgi:hypothetical protein